MAINPREKLQGSYDKAEEAKKKAADAKKLVDGVASVGSGPVTFADIDKWLADNPDAQYFRIGNGGGSVQGARSYVVKGNPFGAIGGAAGREAADSGELQMWSDNDAAIVGQDIDKQTRDIFRYANISAAPTRQGKRGEKATVGQQYTGSSFFTDNGIEYNTNYGMIYSRDEYGKLKEWASGVGKSDQFLSAGAEKKPTFNSDYGKDKGAILTGTGVDDNRRAGLSTDADDSLANEEDIAAKAKRKLLG